MKKMNIVLISVFCVGLILAALIYSNNGTIIQPPINTTQKAPQKVSNEVTIENFAFVPNILNVKIGDTVTWKNNNNTTHIISLGSYAKDSFKHGETYKHVFKKAGTYNYHCFLRSKMTGIIIVS